METSGTLAVLVVFLGRPEGSLTVAIENVMLGIASRPIQLSPGEVFQISGRDVVLVEYILPDRSGDVNEARKLAYLAEQVAFVASRQDNLCDVGVKPESMPSYRRTYLRNDALFASVKTLEGNYVASTDCFQCVAIQR